MLLSDVAFGLIQGVAVCSGSTRVASDRGMRQTKREPADKTRWLLPAARVPAAVGSLAP